MNYWHNLSWLPVVLCLVIVTVICPPAFAAKHALFIGIENNLDTQHYRKRGTGLIFGPRNDIALLKELLLPKPFQFPEQNIVTLLDQQATHNNIKNAFKELVATVQPDEFVYIHYSGHGSVHDNVDGDDEISSKDQT